MSVQIHESIGVPVRLQASEMAGSAHAVIVKGKSEMTVPAWTRRTKDGRDRKHYDDNTAFMILDSFWEGNSVKTTETSVEKIFWVHYFLSSSPS